MAIDRPTFHEAWYRVASLKPRLLTSVSVFRQHFRGQPWFVLENGTNSEYARLSDEAYGFVGLLDGRRSVTEVWQHCNQHMGDRAPTQGEVIQVLGQLYGANLLYVDLPPDSESLFQRREKHRRREVSGKLLNIMYIHIPLFDPDRFLGILVLFLGWLFGWVGLLLWVGLIAVGINAVVGNLNELVAQSSVVLAPDNLIWLYVAFVVTKVIHEFSHALACKRFGRLNHSAGHVHAMGVMFLIFFPLPYVDASSAWAFRNKWHRMVVGMAGVLAELALAAVAAVVWSRTSQGTLHAIAYNVMFLASVSTLLFNGNPLLRFDAYYVLSDLIEIPNLSQRSKNYLYYLIKNYVWGIKRALNPAYSWGERIWFVFYGLASTLFRIYICVRILLFLSDRLPEQLSLLVPIFAGLALFAWVVGPTGKLLKYLFSGAELVKQRGRAFLTVGVLLAGLLVGLGLLPLPEHWRVEGVLEPNDMTVVFAGSEGFVREITESGTSVTAGESVLIRAENIAMETEKRGMEATLRRLQIQLRASFLEHPAAAQIIEEQISAAQEKLARIEQELFMLAVRAPVSGTWVSPEAERLVGAYQRRGQALGFVAHLDKMVVRATAPQNIAGLLRSRDYRYLPVSVRGKRCPQVRFDARIVRVAPAGQAELPSESLGYEAGGQSPTRRDDQGHTQAAERLFEIRLQPVDGSLVPLRTGQRVIVRIRLQVRPLYRQWYHRVRQLFQRRYFI